MHQGQRDTTRRLRGSLRNVGDADAPLLDRVPTVDEFGGPVGDLLIPMPRLRAKSESQIRKITHEIQNVLESFGRAVVFAELNVNRNQLWISVRPSPGIRALIAAGIHQRYLATKLVAHLYERQMRPLSRFFDQKPVGIVLLFMLDQFVARCSAKRFKICNGARIGGEDFQGTVDRDVIQRFPCFENWQRAIQSFRI